MFDVSPRHRALFESAPGATVTAMVYGKLAYRHEPQAVKPASRPLVKPWSLRAMPNQNEVQRAMRQARAPKQAPKSRVAAIMAARAAHRAALAA